MKRRTHWIERLGFAAAALLAVWLVLEPMFPGSFLVNRRILLGTGIVMVWLAMLWFLGWAIVLVFSSRMRR